MSDTLKDALFVSVAEAARLLAVSKRTVESLVAKGDLPSRKIGARRLILLAGLREWAAL